jgi:hypothetical protein
LAFENGLSRFVFRKSVEHGTRIVFGVWIFGSSDLTSGQLVPGSGWTKRSSPCDLDMAVTFHCVDSVYSLNCLNHILHSS